MKFLIFVLIFFSFLFLPFLSLNKVDARSGCCSWHGGVCGCSCCDGTSLSSTCAPYYPECSGGSSYYSRPSCPLHSSYDSLSEQCECNYGYVVYNGSCISDDQYCRNTYGFNSRYNSFYDKCECNYGYLMYGGECISETQFCNKSLGYNSQYDSLSDSCECISGYVYDDTTNSCISGSQACRNEYGLHTNYIAYSNECECSFGYVFNESGTKCISQDEACEELLGPYGLYDSVEDSCKCEAGYMLKGSVCARITPTVVPVDLEERDSSEQLFNKTSVSNQVQEKHVADNASTSSSTIFDILMNFLATLF